MPRRRSFMKRDIKLYNLIFPMWGIYFYAVLFPYFFVLLLPANFIVDTVMLLLLFFLFKVPEKKELYRKGILLEEGKKKKIAPGMAILTAPYLMYLSPL